MKFTGRLIQSVHSESTKQSNSLGENNLYEKLYESLAQSLPPEIAIGGGDFEQIGKLLLSVLVDVGLKPENKLFDLGCGTGRLSIRAIEYLDESNYFGSDISMTMLMHARQLTSRIKKSPTFIHQTQPIFDKLPVFDFICAFSVFTHMEPEDTFLYLKSALDISNQRTKFVLSVIPLKSKLGAHIFTNSASMTLQERWLGVRNVPTSPDFFEEIARMAGWRLIASYDGESETIPIMDSKSFGQLDQTVCVLEPL